MKHVLVVLAAVGLLASASALAEEKTGDEAKAAKAAAAVAASPAAPATEHVMFAPGDLK